MNRLISKTTVLVALATVLFSCKNDDLKDDSLEIDANKEFALTAPNGTTLEFKDAHITKYWDNRYSFFATTEGQYWNEIVSLMIGINNLNNYKTNEEIKVEKMDFGMFASSNSNYTTSEYKGKIYLLSISESEASFYFDDLTFNIADGAYTINGNLSFPLFISITNEFE